MAVVYETTLFVNDFLSEQIHEARSKFQHQWVEGKQPRIDDYLQQVAQSDQGKLFSELLAIELQQRRKSGETPSRDEYIERFSEFSDTVVEQFDAVSSFSVRAESTIFLDSSSPKPEFDLPPDVPSADPIVNRYRLIHMIGKGGFGEVWRAFDEKLECDVAIKGPRRDRGCTPVAAAEFVSEARKVRDINCPGIVPVLDVVEESGKCFIVMELMEAGSLSQRMAAGNFSHREAARLVADVAQTLHHAHTSNYVHRDIKPSNILLDASGNVYVADLGMAVTEEDLLDEEDSVVGTINYMPPEQASGKSQFVDARADIYSLGVVLFELLTGRAPFMGKNRREYLDQILQRDGPRPPRTLDDSIPKELERICLKCLSKDVDRRYTTALDLHQDLKKWLAEDEAVSEPAAQPTTKAAKWLMIGFVAALLGAIGVGALVALSDPWSDNDNIMKQLPSRFTNSAGMEFILIATGEFMMGAPETEEKSSVDERPQHLVRITKTFYMSKFELTKAQRRRVIHGNQVDADEIDNEDGRLAAADFSWSEAKEFCEKLSALPEEIAAGRRYRLPTEAEWEFCCRAGTATAYHFGEEFSPLLAIGGRTELAPVGNFPSNQWGLCDMHGNVWEWCSDYYGDYNKNPVTDPQGARSGSSRVARGGAWDFQAHECRSANRQGLSSNIDNEFMGLRVVCEIISP